MPLTSASLDRIAALLYEARHAVALTGAGSSTPSGIPDFRSPDSGLWAHADPSVVASMIGFRREPENFYAWVRPLARRMLAAQPNPSHIALARLEQMGLLKAIITQNIDMLHSKAGSQTVYEVHGHLRTATCVECFTHYPTDPFLEDFLNTGALPHCKSCGGLLKPDVVLFGEALPFKVLQAAQREARQADLMLVAGSSLEVAPVSELPLIAIGHGARLVVINYDQTYVDGYADAVVHDDVSTVLPDVVERLVRREEQGT